MGQTHTFKHAHKHTWKVFHNFHTLAFGQAGDKNVTVVTDTPKI